MLQQKTMTETKKVSHTDCNTLERYEREPEICSLSGWRCAHSQAKQLCDSTVILYGQTREILCSNPIFCKKEGRGVISKNCLCANKS